MKGEIGFFDKSRELEPVEFSCFQLFPATDTLILYHAYPDNTQYALSEIEHFFGFQDPGENPSRIKNDDQLAITKQWRMRFLTQKDFLQDGIGYDENDKPLPGTVIQQALIASYMSLIIEFDTEIKRYEDWKLKRGLPIPPP
jgi:hypothetical protein